MSNANDGINLKCLETIGDSFLNFAITSYFYCAHPTVHEGKLSHMRSKRVSNLYLYRLGLNKRLDACMIASKFEPHDNWLPPCHRSPPTLSKPSYDPVETGRSQCLAHNDMRTREDCRCHHPADCYIPYNFTTQHSIPDKSIADCVEALIECGPRGALLMLFMSRLRIKVLPRHESADHPYAKNFEITQKNGDDEKIEQAVQGPAQSAVSQVDLSQYKRRAISFLARNFYNFEHVALVLAFCIIFVLLLYKVLLTVKLLTIIVYIYTVIAFNFFRKSYVQEEDDDVKKNCQDMLTCFVFNLYKGVRAGGGIGDELEPPDGDDSEVYRIIFYIYFFFFIIVILLAILQGLIIDAFGKLRDQLESVKEDMESNCFICGTGKEDLNKVPHSFDTHVQKEDNLANYMFFLMHLNNKPDTEYTGLNIYLWSPTGRSSTVLTF